MKFSKTSITLGSLTLMASAYFLFPLENESANNTTGHNDTRNTTVNSTQSQTPIAQTNTVFNAPKPAVQRNIEVEFVFTSTQDYEASSQYGNLPSYMADTNLEKFSFDANGKLIINEKIKHIIEFFLMATQEEGQEQAIARLKEYIAMTLPLEAANEALVIVDNYLNYKDSLHENEEFSLVQNLNENSSLSELKLALANRKLARQQYLGEATSDAFFEHEEHYDDFVIARIEINSNDSLSDTEKDQRIAKAETKLPPEIAQRMKYKRVEKNITKQIQSLKEEGGHEQEIYTLRKDFYGEKVANRMDYLEDNSDEWLNKIEQFNQEKDQILAQGNLSQTEKDTLVSEAKKSLFTHKELIKLAVQSIRG